ncbi:hypothetical protein PRIPAC_82340 [Pristionchus pacificus]|uniref:Uncharacterized protein n=1 Tax=Pristionchus pacificus TaxID=54126 RepID=A0A2A6CLH1_PRIPA|nr:hypothetical protein PRIPAC_82340 [Pristionchus pacificus]|eukprot:PDM78950.1 hypothetical protein PRIPAC_31529 [Pristionchus pacificus]
MLLVNAVITITKERVDMSLCVLGMAEEFKTGRDRCERPLSADWYAITAASDNLSAPGGWRCRKVDIMSDAAAHAMLSKQAG